LVECDTAAALNRHFRRAPESGARAALTGDAGAGPSAAAGPPDWHAAALFSDGLAPAASAEEAGLPGMLGRMLAICWRYQGL